MHTLSVSPAPAPLVAAGLRRAVVALPTGVSLAVHEAGDPAGEPVVFLHGYTDSSRSFLATIERLRALRPELRLVAVDLRGHGGSSLPDVPPETPELGFGPAEFAGDVLAVLDALAIERAHLVGHSLGSFVAQVLALDHPERVRRAVWIGTTARVAGNPVVRDVVVGEVVEGRWRAAAAARGLAWPRDVYARTPLELDPEAQAYVREAWAVEPAADPAFCAAMAHDAVRTPLGSWIGMPRAFAGFDLFERLRDLRVPALVIAPTQDVFFPEEPDQALLRAALADAAARRGTPSFWKAYGARALPADPTAGDDLGHNAPWAAPDALARDLAAFLRPGGAPTRDLPHATPDGPARVALAPGSARIAAFGANAAAPAAPAKA